MRRLILVIVIVDFVVVLAALGFSLFNQELRREVGQRQQLINQGLSYTKINQWLINSLTALATKNNDERIRALLANNGIKYSLTPPAQANAPGPGTGKK